MSRCRWVARRKVLSSKSTAEVFGRAARAASPNAALVRESFWLISWIALTWCCILSTPGGAADWPMWRGPQANGVTEETDLPLHWSRESHVRWRFPLPEPGNSTPIVWGDKVWITQPRTETAECALVGIDRTQGELLWQRTIRQESEDPTHRTNPYCSPSPVTDGERVICWFGSAGLICYDLEGEQLWRKDLGPQRHMWGYAASPVLHNDLCILSFGPGEREFVVAVNKRTGETVWKVDEEPPPEDGDWIQNGTNGPGRAEPGASRSEILRGSWATPLIVEAEGRPELILCPPGRVQARDPASGELLWKCKGLGPLVYASPLAGENTVVAMGGYHAAAVAVRPGGRGDVTATHQLWRQEPTQLLLGTGLIRAGRLYTHTMDGKLSCWSLSDGDRLWQTRLPNSGGKSDAWSSLVESGDRIYLVNQAGDTLVFRVEPKFELLATNVLDETTNASPVPAYGNILIRTHEALWCLGVE